MPNPHHRESEGSTDSSSSSEELDRCLSKKQRLTHSSLFSETFSQNKKWVGRSFVLWLRRGPETNLRLGLVTSKKVHNRANKRNLARRKMREAFRHLRPYLSGDFDILLVGRRNLLTSNSLDTLREMIKLASRAGIITKENQIKARNELGLNNDPKADH